MNIKKLFAILLLSAFLFLITGCGGPAKTTQENNEIKPHYGDFFVIAIGAEPVTLNPLLISDTKSGAIEADIFNGLIKYNWKSEPEGDLAESWNIQKISDVIFVHLEEDSKITPKELIGEFNKNKQNFLPIKKIDIHKHWDGSNNNILEITYNNQVPDSELEKWREFNSEIVFVAFRYEVDFYLKQNVKWHDGNRFTAADVDFTYKKIIDPDTKMPYFSRYRSIKEVKTTGRFSIKVVYWKPLSNLLMPWGTSIVPKHILENVNMKESNFSREPIGTGPYKMHSWNTGESIILSVNEDYFEGKPYFEKYVYKIIPDRSQQFLALANGQIDYMKFSFDQYKNYKTDREFESRFNIYKLPDSTGYSFIGYNQQNKQLRDINVRKALTHAINIPEIIEGIYYGNATRITGPYRHDSWAYNKDVKAPDYNPEKSKEFLMKSGYRMNSEGWMEKDGEILEIELMTNTDDKEREHIGRFVKEYWKNIGVKCNFIMRTWKDLLGREDTGDFQAVLRGWGLGITPDIFGIWHSSRIPSEEHPHSMNSIRYKNQEVDDLLKKIRFTVEKEEREPMCKKVHELIANDYPYTFMFAEDYITVIDKRIHGVKLEDGHLNSWLDWFVPKHLVRYK